MLNSEPIFADYLTENRFNWKYELPIGLSKPDFSVWQDEATPYAFWDVADREPSAQEEAEVDALIRRLREGTEPATEVQGGPSKGYYFVRSKIRSNLHHPTHYVAPQILVSICNPSLRSTCERQLLAAYVVRPMRLTRTSAVSSTWFQGSITTEPLGNCQF